jgi:hypothetical protein
VTAYLLTLYGALIVMCVLTGLFFLRYWSLTRDRFFLWLAGAFGTFSVSWTLLACDTESTEHTSYIYAVRLVGFLLIVIGIVLKNQPGRE